MAMVITPDIPPLINRQQGRLNTRVKFRSAYPHKWVKFRSAPTAVAILAAYPTSKIAPSGHAGTRRAGRRRSLAFECGLHRTFVAHVERLSRNISLDNVERLAKALGVETYELLQPRSDS
jgi:hypothetical protein